MTTITKMLSVLAIAATALTVTAFSAIDANAGFHRAPSHISGGNRSPILGRGPIGKIAPGRLAGKIFGHGPINCLGCHLPRPRPTHMGHGSGHGWGHGWGRGYGYGYGIYPATVYAAPVGAVAAAPAMAAAQPMAAPVQQASNCNCVTKQTLPDGNQMFVDTCTNQSAMVQAPQQ